MGQGMSLWTIPEPEYSTASSRALEECLKSIPAVRSRSLPRTGGFPDAIFITGDSRTFYVAETFGHGLLKFDTGPDGKLSNRQQVWAVKDYVVTPEAELEPRGSHDDVRFLCLTGLQQVHYDMSSSHISVPMPQSLKEVAIWSITAALVQGSYIGVK